MIELKNVSKTYNSENNTEFHALKDLSLTIRRGEFVTVLGKSGSGKSTLLNIIGGLDVSTSGDLIIDGISTKNFPDKDWDNYRNERIGFIFQSFNLISHLTALENVELIMKINRVSKEERRKRAIELLELVGLKDQMDKKPAFMSGGQQQRVAIARALANDPEIILADEPTGSLDSNTSKEILELIKEVGKGRIVIFITHDHDLVKDFETRLIKLKDGMIEEDLEIKEAKLISDKVVEVNKKPSYILWDILKIALNNINRKKRKMLLMSFGLIVGSFTMILGLALGKGGYQVSYEQIRENDNVSSYTVNMETDGFTTDDIANIENIDNVTMVSKNILDEPIYGYNIIDEVGISQFKINASVLPDDEDKFLFKDNLILGRYPEEENEVIINIKTALDIYVILTKYPYNYVRYNKGELSLDFMWHGLNNYTMTIYKPVFVPGQSQPERVDITDVRIVGVFNPDINEYRVNDGFFMLENLAKTIYIGLNDDDDNLQQEQIKPSSITVFMKDYDLKSRQELKSKIEALNSQFIVDDSVDQKIEKSFALIDIAYIFTFLLVVIGFIAAAIMITVVIYSSVMERKKEIGILKAIGTSRTNILLIFLVEGLIIGVIGTSIGLILATIAIQFINPSFNDFLYFITRLSSNKKIFIVDVKTYLLTFFIGIFVAFCGGIIPARKAASIYPVDALREE